MADLGIEQLGEILKVEVADFNMVASVTVLDTDTDSIPKEMFDTFLKNKGIVYGMDEQMIELLCAHPLEYLGRKVDIAKGRKAINGEDAYIEWAIENTKEKKPKELEDGTVDYYSVSEIINVKQGQLLAKKIKRTDGEDGISVYGKKVQAKKGKDVHFKKGKNVVVNEEKDKLYAAIHGQLVINKDEKINVFPIYEVNSDLDFNTGNIDFLGTVVIRGNVPDGFKIKATGDIEIYGNVEGSELIADGDIIIQQGVIGHNKSYIKSNKNVKAAFILDGDVYASENVQVSQSIMHSNVNAGKQVICNGAKGIVVGGKIQAGKRMLATIVGNELATNTVIEVGINPELRMELNQIKTETKKQYQAFDKIKKAMQLLDRLERTEGQLSAEKKQLRLQLMNQQITVEKKLKTLISREEEIERQFNSFDQATIEVINIAYPGIKLVIGKAVKFVKKEHKHMRFKLEEGEIKTMSL